MKCKDIKSMVFNGMINMQILSSYLNMPNRYFDVEVCYIEKAIELIEEEIYKATLPRTVLRDLIKAQNILQVL